MILQVRHLRAGYRKTVILEDVSFAVAKGEIRVILGGSGCGKSTLLNNILGLERALGGEVDFFGHKIRAGIDPLPEEIRVRTGVLFQNGALLSSLSVWQNVALPLRLRKPWLTDSALVELVAFKLELVGMGHAMYKFPAELSGGMRKRAALARALVLDPEILFCDEPSAGLDPITSRSLDDLLLRLRKELGISIVMVTHELNSIDAVAERLLYLAGGRVLLDGTLDEAKNSSLAEVRSFFLREPGRSAENKPSFPFIFAEA